jgi:hypothetical protein
MSNRIDRIADAWEEEGTVLDRVKGNIVFICDDCDDHLDTGEDDFAEARAELKAAGWATTKENDEWVHRCPECKPRSGDGTRYWERD